MNKTALIASTVFAAALGLIAAAPGQAQTANPALTLEVQNVRVGSGPVFIALFNSEGSWRGREAGAVRSSRVDATGATVRVRFDNLPPGDYAIRLFQDIDANGDLNTGFMGIPSEPYAFSNNEPIRFGPPSWSAARFTVRAGAVSHSVSLSR